MLIELIEVFDAGMGFKFRSLYLNPQHIISIQDSPATRQRLEEGKLPDGLTEGVSFSQLTTSQGTRLIVVGECSEVKEKLFSQRTLLKG